MIEILSAWGVFVMPTTDLQIQCHEFAAGRPALAFLFEHLVRQVDAFGEELWGQYPDAPHPFMRNAKLPLYGLAYSGFVTILKLDRTNEQPTLEVALTATVHPFGEPARVIATYEVTLDAPLDIFLDYSQATRDLRWAPRTSPIANITPRMEPDAEIILESLGVPAPVLDTYQRKVEEVIVWSTSNNFVQLVFDALPSIDVGEMVPWLTMLEPLQIDYGQRHVVVTSDKAKMSIGECSPVEVIVEPDPRFPYGVSPPAADTASRTAVAVYLPKTRILEFVARNIMPAVMYDSGENGGIIKWRMSGAIGLKKFAVDISGAVQVGNPFSNEFTLRGTLSASTAIALSGTARAWVDGPCGTKIGLASASIQGDGRFAADIAVTYRGSGHYDEYGGTLEGQLIVTRSELDPNIHIDAVGWPIDDIIGNLTEHLVKKEVRKVAGAVTKLGRWEIAAVPSWLTSFLDQRTIGPVVESLGGVSSIVGIALHEG
jgi:hypothetical protein